MPQAPPVVRLMKLAGVVGEGRDLMKDWARLKVPKTLTSWGVG